MRDLDAPYDPDPLRAGDRIRVRLSGECRGEIIAGQRFPHFASEDGRTGEIRGCTPATEGGHDYDVYLDEIPGGTGHLAYRWMGYARTELERLT